MVQRAVVVGGARVCLIKVVYATRTGHGLRPANEGMKRRLVGDEMWGVQEERSR